MTFLLQHSLDSVDWAALRSADPRESPGIPRAVRELVSAATKADATRAYWQLDNLVVVQGQLYEAALPLVPVLLAALSGPMPEAARHRVADLLLEIACGASDQSEVALGNPDLGGACRRAAGAGLWLIYEMLQSPDADLRQIAIQIAYAVDEDRPRVQAVLDHLRVDDPDSSVKAAAVEFSGYMPGNVFEA